MAAPAQHNGLARLFAVLIGMLLWWPAMGPAPRHAAETAAERANSAPPPGFSLNGDSLTAEEVSESDDSEDQREPGPLADLLSRVDDDVALAGCRDLTDRDELAPRSAWSTLARERGPPLI